MNREFPAAEIARAAKRCPGKTAIKSENQSVSYLELEEKSNRIANFMHRRIADAYNVIIILDRSPVLIESIIGLLKCGAVFVPLDPLFPPNRVKSMIEETRAKWVITDVNYYERFKDVLNCDGNGLNALLIDAESDGFDANGNNFYLDPAVESGGLTFEQEFNKNGRRRKKSGSKRRDSRDNKSCNETSRIQKLEQGCQIAWR